jgi:hypothetical protein
MATPVLADGNMFFAITDPLDPLGFATDSISNEYGFAMMKVHHPPKILPVVRFSNVRISCRFTVIPGQGHHV